MMHDESVNELYHHQHPIAAVSIMMHCSVMALPSDVSNCSAWKLCPVILTCLVCSVVSIPAESIVINIPGLKSCDPCVDLGKGHMSITVQPTMPTQVSNLSDRAVSMGLCINLDIIHLAHSGPCVTQAEGM